ncbi:MAG TPA: type II toxin-antitoxin system RelE/ParE family toxin [Blastocatellia bacterium]|nr:type II toxin-antitoxin system RelE/ParE family toxin [Blastocatellia bacterium]
MGHRVIWSDDAVEDLQQISDYIARDSGHYARVVVRRILERTQSLSRYPRIGHVVPEVDDEAFREILVHSYRVIYRVERDRIIIEAVAHGKQDLHFDN